MTRNLRAELDGAPMTINDAIRALVRRGFTNPEIKSCLANATTTGTLESRISFVRKELGGTTLEHDVETRRIFGEEAIARGMSANSLMAQVLRAIAADNLFEAVLGDELPPKIQRGADVVD